MLILMIPSEHGYGDLVVLLIHASTLKCDPSVMHSAGMIHAMPTKAQILALRGVKLAHRESSALVTLYTSGNASIAEVFATLGHDSNSLAATPAKHCKSNASLEGGAGAGSWPLQNHTKLARLHSKTPSCGRQCLRHVWGRLVSIYPPRYHK